jgi:isocitrate dehydrogenase
MFKSTVISGCVPTEGSRIEVSQGHLNVPDDPVIPFIAGDGIGPDIMQAARRVLDAGVQAAYNDRRRIVWMEVYAGTEAQAKYGHFLPVETLEAIRTFVVAIKGPLTTPVGGGYRSLNVALRQELDLYACVRPVRYIAGVPSPMREPEKVDVVIFRENTEDVYVGYEWAAGSDEARRLITYLNRELATCIAPHSAVGIKPMSEFGSKRLVRKAVQYAIEHGRKSITLVHKGNIMKCTEGAFCEWGYQVAYGEFSSQTVTEREIHERYNGQMSEGLIVIKDRIADNMFQQMLTRPAEYDIIATPNLNGDYLSDAIAAQVGGLGMAPGANIGDHLALFEPTHGSAPKYADLDQANPTSLILSGVMMLEYLGWNEAADLITDGLTRTIQQRVLTYDLARQMNNVSPVKTSEFAAAVIDGLRFSFSL